MRKPAFASGIRPFRTADMESMDVKDWAILSDYANVIKQAQTREEAMYLVIKSAIAAMPPDKHDSLFQVDAAKAMMPLIEKQLSGQLSKNAAAIKSLAMEHIREALSRGNTSDAQLTYPLHAFYSIVRSANRKNGPVMRKNCTNMYMVTEHKAMQDMLKNIRETFGPTVLAGFNILQYDDGKQKTWQACLVIEFDLSFD